MRRAVARGVDGQVHCSSLMNQQEQRLMLRHIVESRSKMLRPHWVTAHFRRRNCKVLARGQLLDGLFVLLHGALTVHVTQKVRDRHRRPCIESREHVARLSADSWLPGADINNAAGAALRSS